MPAPVIDPTQSVLGFAQWEYFEYQPFATNGPSRWRANNALQLGLSLDAVTGNIFGAAERPGVKVIGLTAINGYEVTRIVCVKDEADSLDGLYLIVPDAAGSVGIWIDVDNSGTAEPAHGAARDIEITAIETGGTAAANATAIGAILAADGAWHVRVYGDTIWLYDVALGVRTAATPETSTFAVEQYAVGAVAETESAEVAFTIGIEPGALIPDSLPWIGIDTVTGAISVDGVEVENFTKANFEDGTAPYALLFKEGDDLLLRVSFLRGGLVQDIDLNALRLVLKEFEPDAELIVSTEAIAKQGSGSGTSYLLHATLVGDAVASALSGYEDDHATAFLALAGFEYKMINTQPVGPAELVRSSRTFLVRAERDIADG